MNIDNNKTNISIAFLILALFTIVMENADDIFIRFISLLIVIVFYPCTLFKFNKLAYKIFKIEGETVYYNCMRTFISMIPINIAIIFTSLMLSFGYLAMYHLANAILHIIYMNKKL
jgi:hypothetical protein